MSHTDQPENASDNLHQVNEYRIQDLINTPAIAPKDIHLSDFMTAVRKLQETFLPPIPNPSLFFRGQANAEWAPIPGIFRPESSLCWKEDTIINEVLSNQADEFRHDKTNFEKLVRMQHFGIPTCLLDITRNPLVALYFAVNAQTDKDCAMFMYHMPVQSFFDFQNAYREYINYTNSIKTSILSNMAFLSSRHKGYLYTHLNNNKHKLTSMQHIQKEFYKNTELKYILERVGLKHDPFDTDINLSLLCKSIIVIPLNTNKRLIAQQGAFILFGGFTIEQHTFAKQLIPIGMKLVKITIPAGAKENLRRELDFIGINGMTLFPDLEKTADYIKEKYGSA